MALVWFITGVSSGFGLQIALKALEHGHEVIGTVRSRERAAHAVGEIEGKGGKVLELDVTHPDACFNVWDEAEKLHGRVDVLCNNAGMSYMGALEDYTDAEIHAQMDVNVYGPFRLIRAALPGFRERKTGTIVNISSVSGIDGGIASGLYATSKFALEGLSEALAKELAEHNITTLLVEPGAFRTNFLGAFVKNSCARLEFYSTATKTMDIFSAFAGKQKGDPAKAAERIVEAVDGQGMAGFLKGKVLRLPLGVDCLGRYEAKVKALEADLEIGREVAASTGFEE